MITLVLAKLYFFSFGHIHFKTSEDASKFYFEKNETSMIGKFGKIIFRGAKDYAGVFVDYVSFFLSLLSGLI